MPWPAPFDEPIRLRGGRELSTLQHAADDIMKLPEAVQHEERRQIAVKNLINAAEAGGSWLMFARIAMMRALNGEEYGKSEPLFQRRIDRVEIGVEAAANAINRGEYHNTEADRDQTIFDGCCAGFVVQKS